MHNSVVLDANQAESLEMSEAEYFVFFLHAINHG